MFHIIKIKYMCVIFYPLKNTNFLVFYLDRSIIYNCNGNIIHIFEFNFKLPSGSNNYNLRILKDSDTETYIIIADNNRINFFFYNFQTNLGITISKNIDFGINTLHIFSETRFLSHGGNKSKIWDYDPENNLLTSQDYKFKNGNYIDFRSDAKINNSQIILGGMYLYNGYIIILDVNTLRTIYEFKINHIHIDDIYVISQEEILIHISYLTNELLEKYIQYSLINI